MLGNYVQYLMENDIVSKPVKVNAIFNDFVEVTNGEVLYDLEELEMVGILITEELLLKCGYEKHFTEDTKKPYFKDENTILLTDDKLSSFAVSANTNIGGIWSGTKDLHQLQNAYFILTGEHLKVNLIENE